jgi:hypothetical protein
MADALGDELMIWSRSETLALAQQSCTFCYGLGLRAGRNGCSTPCNCVFRNIFKACYARFRQCTSKEKYISRVSLEANPGRQRKSVWGLKNEEYIADFTLVSRRTLQGDALQTFIFKYHYLYGADWKAVVRQWNAHPKHPQIDRGMFFHEVYRIQQRLGRVFRELEPHSLFPLDEYFNGTGRQEVVATPLPSMFAVVTEKDLPKHAPVTARRRLQFPLKAAMAS